MVDLLLGDCREVMAALAASSIDAIVTDPPYGLEFMGRDWDHGVPGLPFWAAALRVARPGAHLVAFGGTRTFHRLACALEDAGWELRDTLMWVYGSGFPKSLDVSKAIDKAAGAERETVGVGKRSNARGLVTNKVNWERPVEKVNWERPVEYPLTAPATDAARRWAGWGTALKPAWEPILLARKPLDGTVAANVQKHGTGALNIDACRVPGGTSPGGSHSLKAWRRQEGRKDVPAPPKRRMGGRRWPANLVHDGSNEVLALMPLGVSGGSPARRGPGGYSGGWAGQEGLPVDGGSSGSAARFFYCAKASRAEREAGLEMLDRKPGGALHSGDGGWMREEARGRKPRHLQQLQVRNHHPTVKPVALMRYLVRLVTPPGGLVLDPFLGSGTTGVAAVQEGLRLVGIEQDAAYLEIARWRIAAAEVPEPLFACAVTNNQEQRTNDESSP